MVRKEEIRIKELPIDTLKRHLDDLDSIYTGTPVRNSELRNDLEWNMDIYRATIELLRAFSSIRESIPKLLKNPIEWNDSEET